MFKFITTAKLSSMFFGLLMVCLLTAASGCAGVQYDLPFKHERHIAVGIAGSDDHVYYWYADGSVSSGTTDNRTQYRGHYASNISASKSLVVVGIAGSNDHVYYWYSDGTGSNGTTDDPLRYSVGYYPSNQAPNKTLLAAGIAGNDHVYYWYSDGTGSHGSSTNPTQYNQTYYQTNPSPGNDLMAAGIAGSNDHVYYWYANGTISSGTSTDRIAYAPASLASVIYVGGPHSAGIQGLGHDLGGKPFKSGEKLPQYTGSGQENREWILYGRGVYAMRDGNVIACWRNAPENPKPGESHSGHDGCNATPASDCRIYGGGNGFWIQHSDGTRAEYAHMIPGTVPADLCPNNAIFTPNMASTNVATAWQFISVPAGRQATVKRGQFLGRVGNTGTGSNPHLHIHVETGGTVTTSAKAGGTASPLNFTLFRYRKEAATVAEAAEIPWQVLTNQPLPTTDPGLVNP